MKLKCRTTHNFAELKVDEIETTIFKSEEQEVLEVIENLTDVIDDLAKLIGKDFTYSLTES